MNLAFFSYLSTSATQIHLSLQSSGLLWGCQGQHRRLGKYLAPALHRLTAQQSTPHSPEPSALNVAGEEGGSWGKLLFVRITHHGEMWVGCSWGKRKTSLLLKPGVEQPIPKSCQLLRTQTTASRKQESWKQWVPTLYKYRAQGRHNTQGGRERNLPLAHAEMKWTLRSLSTQISRIWDKTRQQTTRRERQWNGTEAGGQPGGVSSHDLQEPIAKHLGNLRPDGYIISSLKSDTVRISTQ